jgi:cycloeucalenol cycloisomerase
MRTYYNFFSNLVYLCYLWFRIDEQDEKWNLSRVAVDSLGAAMLVTIILDLWRIFLGPIVPIPESRQCGQPGLAWFQV